MRVTENAALNSDCPWRIKIMMRRGGHPTDSRHDHDFTDWDAVWRFGREIAGMVVAPTTVP